MSRPASAFLVDGERANTVQVVVFADGRVCVGSKPAGSDEEIVSAARAFASQSDAPAALLMVDSQVTYGRVVHVMDMLRQGGVTRMSFAVEAE